MLKYYIVKMCHYLAHFFLSRIASHKGFNADNFAHALIINTFHKPYGFFKTRFQSIQPLCSYSPYRYQILRQVSCRSFRRRLFEQIAIPVFIKAPCPKTKLCALGKHRRCQAERQMRD